MTYLLLFVSGLFLANAFPHLVRGLTGQRFPTPWGLKAPYSTAASNALWGWINLTLAINIGLFVLSGKVRVILQVNTVLLGFLIFSLYLGSYFGKRKATKS